MPSDPAVAEAQWLLAELTGRTDDQVLERITPGDEATRWAASGAMALTGSAEGPPAAPRAPVASRLLGAAAVLEHLSALVGTAVRLDGPALLGERAALRRLRRQGRVSAGGSSRLLPAADGWLVVTLPRPEDVELVPAWLEGDDASWASVEAATLRSSAAVLAARGQELGLAVGVVPSPGAAPDEQLVARGQGTAPWLLTRGAGPRRTGRPRVVDLSALWAGPLCGQILGAAGADVVTVESPDRPDGARRGDPDLHALLHAGHSFEQVDLRSPRLRELVDEADVVLTAARPRALRQLGIWPPDEVARRPGLTWVAITGYGLTGPWCDRVGYGDDAAATGGLVADGPAFCADAAADPATGLYAALGALACLLSGGGLVDVSLREVAHHLMRPPYVDPPEVVAGPDGWVVNTASGPSPVAPPRARRP